MMAALAGMKDGAPAANRLCAKSNAVEPAAIGLDLKSAIDQLREQIQNIE